MTDAAQMMRLGSLFSGAGGLDLAVEHVFGARTVWHCENDPTAAKVLAHRWPGVRNLGDVTAADWSSVEPVDIVCGGYPCQPFSAAGRRKGTADERHLWPYFAEAIRALRPRLIVLENVAGHRSMGFDRVLADLAGLRYDAQWCSLRASDVGAPHRRERLFVIAHPEVAERGGPQQQHLEASTFAASEPRERAGTGAICGRDVADAASDAGRIINGDNGTTSDTACDGRHERWPESARLIGRPDASLSGAGPVNLLPTPRHSDAGPRGGTTGFGLRNWTRDYIADLLPTPNAQDGNGGCRYNSEGHQSTLLGEVRLLPTPKASDGQRGDCLSERERNDPSLVSIDHYLVEDCDAASEKRSRKELRDMRNRLSAEAFREWQVRGPHCVSETDALFPGMREQSQGGASGQSSVASPTDQTEGLLRGLRHDRETAHSPHGPQSREQRSDEPADSLQQLSYQAALAGGPGVSDAPHSGSRWGRYEAAIRRWEAVLGRVAPDPTEPNRNGNPRLNPEFSSWMMGWPEGWVTDVPGISRNDALRIIGNGVVPQQAIAALSWLLWVSEEAA